MAGSLRKKGNEHNPGRAKPLKAYESKRDFKQTAEPRAVRRKTASRSKFRFVVQKHDARRLHFDLRLELDGVLRSWAVTKGPTMTAGLKRLAVETEDHPIGYLQWEGVIPKGQYGGGTMIVWDHGVWSSDGDATQDLAAGKLSFTLVGQRLKGRFTLVRMKPEGKRHNWLLIKGADEFSLPPDQDEPALTETASLLSGRANAELERGGLRPDHRARQKKASDKVATTSALRKIPGAKGGILPAFVQPSLALSVTQPPLGGNWLHEIKYDGYRIQARLEGGKVTLLTRTGLDWTSKFPPVAARLADMPVGAALIDGEIVVQDASGLSNFNGLQDDLKARRHGRLAYFAFDLLHCNGVDLRDTTLVDRKNVLQQIVEATPKSFALRFCDHLEEHEGGNILAEACRLGLEGIVSKRLDMTYRSGRGEHWQKSKCTLRQEFVIAGFVPSIAQPRAVGSVVLGYREDGVLVHAGRAGTGLNAREAADLAERLEKIRISKPEFSTEPTAAAARGVRWVKPTLGVEIEYRGWSSQGLLRQAAIIGIRDDKPASEIVLERPQALVNQKRQAVTADNPTSTMRRRKAPASTVVNLSHPEKVLWPDAGVTKQQLADYHVLVAERMLLHVADRPLALLRCPHGTDGQCFFAKHAWMGASSSIHTVDTGSEKPTLVVDDAAGLAGLVQMNVLEIHVWGSTRRHLEKPDRMIFDLDPDDALTCTTLRSAAAEVRDRLSTIGLQSFLKSTGGKGLHVVVPLTPDANWDQVKDFSRAFAMLMAENNPEKYTAVMSKSRRRGKIFIDYLRNGRGATAIAPYSTRARTGAPVAMPLAWKQLDGGRPLYRVRDILQSGKLPGDPWPPFASVKQKLPH